LQRFSGLFLIIIGDSITFAFMVKNVIFDFGGVLYNLDFGKTRSAFEALGFSDFDNMFSQFQANALFQHLETGSVSKELFYEQIKTIALRPVTNDQIRDAWNAMLLGYRQKSLDYLNTISPDFNLYLLSNTNQIHHDYFSSQFIPQSHQQSLDDYFSKAWYSHIIGLRKPNEDAFSFVLNDAGINASDTLFVDDTHSNLPPAAALGIKTYLLKPGELIENIDFSKF